MGATVCNVSEGRQADTWFSVLRAATASGDRELQVMARRELERLGFDVRVRKPAPGEAAR